MKTSKPIPRPQIVQVNRAIIIREDGNILLARRSLKDSNHPGLWEFPGGKLEQGETCLDALQNEVEQETGYKVSLRSTLTYIESRLMTDRLYANLLYLSIFWMVRIVGGQESVSVEHETIEWASLSEIPSYTLTPESGRAFANLRAQLLAEGALP